MGEFWVDGFFWGGLSLLGRRRGIREFDMAILDLLVVTPVGLSM
jgi:hypothetical protein